MRSDGGTRGGAVARNGLAGVGVASFAVACCAALPLGAGFVGGVAVGAWLGIGAGVLPVGVVVALAISTRWRARRRDEEQR